MKKPHFEAEFKTQDMLAIGKAAKAVHPEVTLRLDGDGIAFWCKDDRKQCAVVGAMPLPQEDAGAISIRVNAAQLIDQANVFDLKGSVALVVRDDEDGESLILELTHPQTDQYRMMTVTEAEHDDQPNNTPFKATASCTLSLPPFAKIMASFKRNTDMMEIAIGAGMFEASYKSRKSQDICQFACATGEKSLRAKFDVDLVKAAVTAAKAVGDQATVEMMKKGPMRLVTKRPNGMRCGVYVVSSQPI